jgi:hypothetical protein
MTWHTREIWNPNVWKGVGGNEVGFRGDRGKSTKYKAILTAESQKE